MPGASFGTLEDEEPDDVIMCFKGGWALGWVHLVGGGSGHAVMCQGWGAAGRWECSWGLSWAQHARGEEEGRKREEACPLPTLRLASHAGAPWPAMHTSRRPNLSGAAQAPLAGARSRLAPATSHQLQCWPCRPLRNYPHRCSTAPPAHCGKELVLPHTAPHTLPAPPCCRPQATATTRRSRVSTFLGRMTSGWSAAATAGTCSSGRRPPAGCRSWSRWVMSNTCFMVKAGAGQCRSADVLLAGSNNAHPVAM